MNSLILVWVLIVQPSPYGKLEAVDKYPTEAQCETVKEQTKLKEPTGWVYSKCIQLTIDTKVVNR